MTSPSGLEGSAPTIYRVDEVIDRQPVSRLQLGIVVLCAISTVIDGFDAQAIGFLASPLADHFHVDVRSFGQTFALGLFGIMTGALVIGPAGDRWGRKRALIVSMTLVGSFTLATVFAETLGQLGALRYFTGLGIGGASPNIIALLTEYVPKRRRNLAICISAASIPTGGMLAGVTASVVLPLWGWQSMFIIGGVCPLAIAVLLLCMLPESVRFLSLDAANQHRVQTIMRRIWPEAANANVVFVAAGRAPGKIPVGELFREGRSLVTLSLWTAYFMNLMVLYVVVSWLPAMLRTEGMPVSAGILAITTFSLGGIVGSLSQAPLMATIRPALLIPPEFAIFIGLVEYLAVSELTSVTVGVVAFAIGWVIQGAQAGLNVFTATFYPTSARATGIGWGLGIGRIGSICGPILGGAALLAGWSARQILSVGAIPAVMAAVAVVIAATLGIALVRATQSVQPTVH
jgi:AAHS family 4-hydroxybenzoate transporter-like MFS transporter